MLQETLYSTCRLRKNYASKCQDGLWSSNQILWLSNTMSFIGFHTAGIFCQLLVDALSSCQCMSTLLWPGCGQHCLSSYKLGWWIPHHPPSSPTLSAGICSYDEAPVRLSICGLYSRHTYQQAWFSIASCCSLLTHILMAFNQGRPA